VIAASAKGKQQAEARKKAEAEAQGVRRGTGESGKAGSLSAT